MNFPTVSTVVGHNQFGEVVAKSATYGGTPIFSTAYTRDSVGRITAITEAVEGGNTRYAYIYDDANRLTQVLENGTVAFTYSYDANGNRVSADGAVAYYDVQDRLTQYGDTTFAYTSDGQLVEKVAGGQKWEYSYDVFGNLRQARTPGGDTIEYVIDGRHRRVGKVVNGDLVQGFIYGDQLNPIAETDGGGSIRTVFVYGTTANVPSYMLKNGRVYRFVTDHLGSPRLIVDASTGVVAQRLDYDAFGNILLDTNAGFQPFGFAGGIYDQDTGLVRYGARDYDSEIGRWTAKDPLGFGGGDTNLYAYVINNPVNFIDPKGLTPVAGAITGGGIAGPPGAVVGAIIGLGIGLYIGDKMFSEKSPPDRGPPGEWVDGKNRSRKYGPDGKPEIDIDYGHQGYPTPHVHEWPDGEREHPGRDVCPL